MQAPFLGATVLPLDFDHHRSSRSNRSESAAGTPFPCDSVVDACVSIGPAGFTSAYCWSVGNGSCPDPLWETSQP